MRRPEFGDHFGRQLLAALRGGEPGAGFRVVPRASAAGLHVVAVWVERQQIDDECSFAVVRPLVGIDYLDRFDPPRIAPVLPDSLMEGMWPTLRPKRIRQMPLPSRQER